VYVCVRCGKEPVPVAGPPGPGTICAVCVHGESRGRPIIFQQVEADRSRRTRLRRGYVPCPAERAVGMVFRLFDALVLGRRHLR